MEHPAPAIESFVLEIAPGPDGRDEYRLTRRDGGEITPARLAGLTGYLLDRPDVVLALRDAAANGHANALIGIIGIMVMRTTQSHVANEAQRAIVVTAAQSYPFSFWLEQEGIPPRSATREHLDRWWRWFVQTCADAGFRCGSIENAGFGVGLWPASKDLAQKVEMEPGPYRLSDWTRLNNATEVGEALRIIMEPTRWIEVEVGDSMENMRTLCPDLIGAFSIITRDGAISRTEADAIASVALILARGR